MNKWIIITGASSGIGQITAEYLDSCGYNIILIARSIDKLNGVSCKLQQENIAIPFDLCNLENIGDIFQKLKNSGIKLDGLVHCAGIGTNTPIRGNIVTDMENTMATNYFSFVELVKYFGLKKFSNDGASIIAISSISPLTCYPGACNYAASKSAINVAVKVMAKEYLRRQIRVNALLPGYVNTPLGPSEDDPNYIEQQPLGIIKAEYLAYMIEFLLSDKSRYMTGTLIPISGGMNF